MPAPNSGYDSRRGSRSGGETGLRKSDRSEKAKSSQTYAQYSGSAAQGGEGGPAGVVRAGTAPRRPQLGTRTSSAPLVERRRGSGYAAGLQRLPQGHEPGAQAGTGAAEAFQDEDEVAGVVGAMKQYEPFKSPQIEEPIPEMNIAVIGGDGVGKSTFLQKALDLPYPAPSKAADRKIPYDGTLYRIRLLEISIDDVDIDDDDTVSWPDSVADKMMPQIDGVLTLYDVSDRASLDDVPETLAAIHKADLPSVLISCKCDTPPAERQLDPIGIETRAKQAVKTLRSVQTSVTNPGTFKMGLATLVKAVVNGQMDEPTITNRQRAQSNAVRSVSPRPTGLVGHARASSEYTASLHKDRGHSRHDSSHLAHGSSDHLKVPESEQMSNSFLLEESGGESIPGSQRSSTEVEAAATTLMGAPSTSELSENGATFEELVDRLCAQPTSKADGKFVVIFLALYRKFAAPGRLLEAIVERFDAMERNGTPLMIKMVAQLRILSVMEQWITHYPGDFAYQKTRRRVRTFIAKISAVSIFHVAAKEMSSGLEMVQEDDDTEWGYSDKNRNTITSSTYQWKMSSTASMLIDDDSFIFPDNMSVVTANDDASLAPSLGGETIRSTSSTASSQLMFNFESAQRQAATLYPRDRILLSKLEWRMFMSIDDALVARELTRMDWVMFSSIRPRDLVRHVSLKPTEKPNCKNLVNVSRMIEHFNHLAAWVANFILLRDKPKHRALMLEKMMRIARKLRELNNYNALGAFLAGIRGTAVHRLQATRELLPPPVGKDWMKLEILMAHTRSFAAYRLAWENSSAERIPYIPLHRRDLVTAEEGNPTFIGDEQAGRINWKKFEIMGEVIVGLQKAQGLPYRGLGNGRMSEQARELVLDVKLVKDEDELYERSTQLEAPANQGATAGTKFREFFKR